jgi:hypothetical protein
LTKDKEEKIFVLVLMGEEKILKNDTVFFQRIVETGNVISLEAVEKERVDGSVVNFFTFTFS